MIFTRACLQYILAMVSIPHYLIFYHALPWNKIKSYFKDALYVYINKNFMSYAYIEF